MASDLDFDHYSDDELLRLWRQVTELLRQRGVCRTKNIVGEVAERLVAAKLGLTLAPNSTRSYDATGPNGERYQIKARLQSAWNGSTQLSDLSGLDGDPFDFLVAVLFREDFPRVHAAYKIPLVVVRQFARKKGARNVLLAQGPMLKTQGVEDLTVLFAPAAGV